MEEFLSQNASAIFGLAGAFLGGLLSFIASWMIKNREYSLRIWQMLLDRRIKAHENLISLAMEMRVMVSLGREENGEVVRAPQVLISREEFEAWFTRFSQLTQEGSTWLTTEAKREVNFVQDYLVTLHTNLASVPSERFLPIGKVIRQDFIELSSALEKTAYDYFENQIRKRKLSRLGDWHKYPREHTESRLAHTDLLSNWDSVQEAASGDGSEQR
ncbi:hypothetical protein NFC81_02695 [Salinispirillum sp. LH 10-3-1]|uniref:DUF4760 domain-containing protein n=1 Tax=Salinispirillum sp. LH 10-3-1 TaxID=2952525 RepID=A0AB38YHD3_9GAMM